MKWPVAIVAAIAVGSFTLSACSSDNSSSPDPTQQPTAAVSEPTLSASEAKKEAEAEKAREEAYAKELRAWTASIEKAVKAQVSSIDKLSVIITEYCKLPSTARGESEKSTVLEKLYAANWKAGKWNQDLKSAAEQPGACPQPLPTELPKTG